MTSWDHLLLEGYCMYKSMSKKFWMMGELKFDKKGDIKHAEKWNKTENPGYIPKSKRPKWCNKYNKKFDPEFRYLCYGRIDERCPFFGYSNATKSDFMLFQKAFFERSQKVKLKEENK